MPFFGLFHFIPLTLSFMQPLVGQSCISLLCTMQYNSHWIFTFLFVRTVKRDRPLAHRKFPKTGSTIDIRLLYIVRPFTVSIFVAMRSQYSPPLSDLRKTLRILWWPCVKQRVRLVHVVQWRCLQISPNASAWRNIRIGHRVSEMSEDIYRELRVFNYRILYKILNEERVAIIGIVHGRRLLDPDSIDP